MVGSVGELRGGLPRAIVSRVVSVLAGASLLVVGGCGTDGGVSVKPAGLSCVDDSAACVSARSSALEALMADKNRAWVRQQPTAAAYASGVRLFAFKKRKAELSCDELGIGYIADELTVKKPDRCAQSISSR